MITRCIKTELGRDNFSSYSKDVFRSGYRRASIIMTRLNPLSPNNDQYHISPCNINAYSTPEVMRIKNIITQDEFS